MSSVFGLVGRFFWRSWPLLKGGRDGVKKLDHVGGKVDATVGRQSNQVALKNSSRQDGGRNRTQSTAGLTPSSSSSTFQSATHNLFVNSILRRLTNSQTYQHLRRRAADQLFRGNSAPFLALVGVSLASGSGLITKEDELECICKEVRKASKKARLIEANDNWPQTDSLDTVEVPQGKEVLTRSDLEFGPVIAKGCNAVVYFARWITAETTTSVAVANTVDPAEGKEQLPPVLEEDSSVIKAEQIQKDKDDLEIVDIVQTLNHVEEIKKDDVEKTNSPEDSLLQPEQEAANSDNISGLGKSQLNMKVAMDSIPQNLEADNPSVDSSAERKIKDAKVPEDHSQSFPLAVKMMFNYDFESNAITIFKGMQREIIAAQALFLPEETSFLLDNRRKLLPGHPNIVKMVAAFADRIPSLSGSLELYPAALPSRLNPDSGYGRNMSLFLVMKRYDASLRQFLADHREDMSWRTSIVLLTQILEGICHLLRYEVCHRDLKSDNILVDTSGGLDFPLAAITDFGCCLSDKQNGLRLPFSSSEVDRGGNAALMAPEIATAEPGIFTFLDYTKSDVWAAGAIAYEIFGAKNPFYDDQINRKRLDSRTYSVADLPELPETVPKFVSNLIRTMLERQPSKRISAEQAATICQLFLWAPKSWIDPSSTSNPSNQDIIQWMLTMTTKVLYETRFSNGRKAHREYQLVTTFLSRATLRQTRSALDWISKHIE